MDSKYIINRRKALKVILISVASFPVISYLYHGNDRVKEIIITQEELYNLPVVKQHVFINKNVHNEIAVYSMKCTHLGCNLNYDKQKELFVCPCHGSAFNIDGTVIRGPAKISLLKLKSEFDNKGNLIVKFSG